MYRLFFFFLELNVENRVFLSLHQAIHLPFSVYQSQISVLMGIHCILSPLPPLFITLLHAHAHSLWGGPLTRLSICLTPTSSSLLLFFPLPLLLSPSPAHTLASALWLLLPLPRCHLPQHNRERKSGQKMGGRTRRENEDDIEEGKNGTTVKVREKIRESAYSWGEAAHLLPLLPPFPSPPHTLLHTHTTKRVFNPNTHTHTHQEASPVSLLMFDPWGGDEGWMEWKVARGGGGQVCVGVLTWGIETGCRGRNVETDLNQHQHIFCLLSSPFSS